MRISVVTALCLFASCPAMAEGHACQPAVDAAIARVGVAPERVTEYIVAKESLPEAADIGYKFWLRLKGCSAGYLVVDTDLGCNIGQIYTDGACAVPGVPAY